MTTSAAVPEERTAVTSRADGPAGPPGTSSSGAVSHEPDRPSRVDANRWLRPVGAAAIVLLVLLPIAAAAIHASGQPWYAASDRALISLRSGDVGSATPLVGAYSRFGWSHPGPLLFYWLSPFARSAADDRGLLIGAALLNGLSVVVAAVFAYRRRATVGVLVVGAVFLLLMHGFAASLADPWNPYAPVLPFTCFLVLVWAAADGDLWAWPALAVVASFIVQAHVGYAPLVGVMAVWAGIGFAHAHWRWRTRSEQRPRRREVYIAVGCTALLVFLAWLPPLLQQAGANGNLSAMGDFFVNTPKEKAGLETGAGLMETQIALGGPWWTGQEETNPFVGDVAYRVWQEGLVPLGLLAVTTAASFWARRDASLLRLQVTVIVAVAAGALAIAGTVGGVYAYLFRWSWVLGALVWVVIALGVAAFVSRWMPPAHARARMIVTTAAVVGLLVALSISDATLVGGARSPDAEYSGALGALVPPTLAALSDGQAVKVTQAGPALNEVANGVALRLVRNGHPLVVPTNQASIWGTERTRANLPPAVQPLMVVTGVEGIEQVRADPDQREVAHYEGVGPDHNPLQLSVFAATPR